MAVCVEQSLKMKSVKVISDTGAYWNLPKWMYIFSSKVRNDILLIIIDNQD